MSDLQRKKREDTTTFAITILTLILLSKHSNTQAHLAIFYIIIMGSEEPSALIDFFAGWCSGAVSVLMIQPLDTILTRLQATPALSGATSSAAIGTSTVTLQARGLVSNAGVSALWRGSSAMIGAVPMQNALLMGGYGIGKSWNEKTSAQDQALLSNVFIGGCVGGLAQSFLMSPVELVKVRQQCVGQSATTAGKEVLQGLISPSRSWRGLNATILRDGIPHGVWFASYEWTKNKLAVQFEGTSGEKMTVPLVSGAVAATTAWGVGYPFDIIKVSDVL
jgi:solute carrier family 25 (mitochondrial carnitine/acylcarnitine transporter), member 20/29